MNRYINRLLKESAFGWIHKKIKLLLFLSNHQSDITVFVFLPSYRVFLCDFINILYLNLKELCPYFVRERLFQTEFEIVNHFYEISFQSGLFKILNNPFTYMHLPIFLTQSSLASFKEISSFNWRTSKLIYLFNAPKVQVFELFSATLSSFWLITLALVHPFSQFHDSVITSFLTLRNVMSIYKLSSHLSRVALKL